MWKTLFLYQSPSYKWWRVETFSTLRSRFGCSPWQERQWERGSVGPWNNSTAERTLKKNSSSASSKRGSSSGSRCQVTSGLDTSHRVCRNHHAGKDEVWVRGGSQECAERAYRTDSWTGERESREEAYDSGESAREALEETLQLPSPSWGETLQQPVLEEVREHRHASWREVSARQRAREAHEISSSVGSPIHQSGWKRQKQFRMRRVAEESGENHFGTSGKGRFFTASFFGCLEIQERKRQNQVIEQVDADWATRAKLTRCWT